MYVDSRGCVFLRAGLSGRTTWVPRVSSNRKALCGYPPTLQAMAKPVQVAPPAVVAQAPQPAPSPAVGKPIDTVASLKTPPKIRVAPPAAVMSADSSYSTRALPAPVVQPQAQPRAVVMNTAAPRPVDPVFVPMQIGAGKIGCFKSAPVPKVVALSNGGTAVLCTRGDGTLNGVRAPIYGTVAMGEGARVGAGLYPPAGQAVRRSAEAPSVPAPAVVRAAPVRVAGGAAVTYAPAPEAQLTEVVVPKGYKLAWKDDRLNPYRGQGTVTGQGEQDRVWTREVPAQLVVQQVVPGQRVVISTKTPRPMVQISTHSEPKAAAAAVGGKIYVQVGSFGVPANADGARARLRAAGLPTGTARAKQGGKPVQIVLAGPFADASQAQAALRAARSAGFGDAFLR
ncbi:Sporulation related domain-containing protein [Gemmobacter aquatilis]|uniref:Sporulation related domain-containing protein n=1 Tax=Gemmobacter aquatilis TaxID=933059 RepID=A0A1H8HZ02_9RHOB|nr:SPOR domain-containing protein [Gemmobacter aquatilis]SEN61307.1 Sporulation related domain-containing protein [Gemmobacter aquatilis]